MSYISFLIWLQTAYALWQFMRVAKFLRLPYIFISTIWNKNLNETRPRVRKYLKISFGSLKGEAKYEVPEQNPFNFKQSGSVMEFDFIGRKYRVCTSITKNKILSFLNLQALPFVSEELELTEGLLLLKTSSKIEGLYNVLMGGRIEVKESNCIVDQTSSDLLNVNFMRIMSILPLVLQAKGFENWSVYVSSIVIMMDIFSFYLNKIWEGFKTRFFYMVKYILSKMRLEYRVLLHHLLSTGTDSFMFCDGTKKMSYWMEVHGAVILSGTNVPFSSRPESLNCRDCLQVPLNSQSRYYEINGMKHYLFVEKMEDCRDSPMNYNIRLVDCNGVTAERRSTSSFVYKVIKFMEEIQNHNLWPIERIEGNIAHLVSPSLCLNSEKFDGAVTAVFDSPKMIYLSERRFHLTNIEYLASVSRSCSIRPLHLARIFDYFSEICHEVTPSRAVVLVTSLLLRKSAKFRYKDIPNAKWKLVTSDINMYLKNNCGISLSYITERKTSPIMERCMNYIYESLPFLDEDLDGEIDLMIQNDIARKESLSVRRVRRTKREKGKEKGKGKKKKKESEGRKSKILFSDVIRITPKKLVYKDGEIDLDSDVGFNKLKDYCVKEKKENGRKITLLEAISENLNKTPLPGIDEVVTLSHLEEDCSDSHNIENEDCQTKEPRETYLEVLKKNNINKINVSKKAMERDILMSLYKSKSEGLDDVGNLMNNVMKVKGNLNLLRNKIGKLKGVFGEYKKKMLERERINNSRESEESLRQQLGALGNKKSEMTKREKREMEIRIQNKIVNIKYGPKIEDEEAKVLGEVKKGKSELNCCRNECEELVGTLTTEASILKSKIKQQREGNERGEVDGALEAKDGLDLEGFMKMNYCFKNIFVSNRSKFKRTDHFLPMDRKIESAVLRSEFMKIKKDNKSIGLNEALQLKNSTGLNNASVKFCKNGNEAILSRLNNEINLINAIKDEMATLSHEVESLNSLID